MSDARTFVIVGGGLAGAKAAEELRSAGFDGRIVLVAEEATLPYERPPLSKSLLAGDSSLVDAQVHDEAFYAGHAVELLTSTRATGLDPAARRVTLSDGEVLAYDRLLIATGAVARRPGIPGIDGREVHVLRTVADAERLRAAIGAGARLAVIGAGWIGREVAATARTGGAEVTLIEQGAAPLERVLGRRLGDFFAGLEYVGLHDPADELVIHGSLEEARFQAHWLAADGSVSAGMQVNDWDATDSIRSLVEGAAAAGKT